MIAETVKMMSESQAVSLFINPGSNYILIFKKDFRFQQIKCALSIWVELTELRLSKEQK